MRNLKNKGWVRLHRQIEDNDLWFLESFTKAQAWIDLFLNANHKKGIIQIRGNVIEIERGQIGWSELTMVKRWSWSKNKVRHFLKLLETEQQIKQQKTFITTIITILNYDKYQTDDTADDKAERQQKDSRRYTNKNDKNDKNVKKTTETSSVSKYNPLGGSVLKSFEEIDPKNKTYYNNKTQRSACDFLIEEYGLDKVLQAIKILPQINTKKLYIKQITTPYELKENWIKIGNALKQQKNDKNQPNYVL